MSSVLKVDAIQNTAGTSALTIDSSGRMFTPARPSFSATRTSALTVSSTNQTLVFNNVTHNQGSHYDSSTGKFTAPVTGLYYFSAAASIVVGADNRYLVITIQTSDSDYTGVLLAGRAHTNTTSGTTYGQSQCSGVVHLNANDFVLCKVEVENSSSLAVGDPACYFNGFLVG